MQRDLLAAVAEAFDEGFGGLDVEVEDGDLSAATGERAGHFAAENACAAGDGDNESSEVVHPGELRQVKGCFRCSVCFERISHCESPRQFNESSTAVARVGDCDHPFKKKREKDCGRIEAALPQDYGTPAVYWYFGPRLYTGFVIRRLITSSISIIRRAGRVPLRPELQSHNRMPT